MQKYKVIETIIHNCRTYQPGELVELGGHEVSRFGKRVVKHEEKEMVSTPNKMGRKGVTK